MGSASATKYFPIGFLGLVIAVIFTAAMSSSSGELNSLAAVSVMDIYRRHFRPDAQDRHYLIASRVFTALWARAVAFAIRAASGIAGGSCESGGVVFLSGAAGNFHAGLLFQVCAGWTAFWALMIGEATIILRAMFTRIAFLWYNVIGAVVVVIFGVLISGLDRGRRNA